MSEDPGVPAGYRPMRQIAVTSDITAWAVAILHDPQRYPLLAAVSSYFWRRQVLARVEQHPPDFFNESVHRGVTLYELIDESSHSSDEAPAEGVAFPLSTGDPVGPARPSRRLVRVHQGE